MKEKNIIFIPIVDVLEEYMPKPAQKVLPEWYRKQERYQGGKRVPPQGEGEATKATIKACMPVFDAMSSGYIIFTQAYLYVWHEEKDGKYNKYFRWGANQPIGFHDSEQFDKNEQWAKFHSAFKFNNAFIIKTPKGYSCLITAPFNHPNPFKIIDGVVDTDNYFETINFPAVFIDETFEGHIPAGTPIAQIIPFKREKWVMQKGDANNYLKQISATRLYLLTVFFDRYKNKFWTPKEYK